LIYTLTLSPSLERTIDVEEFVYDDVNMIFEERRSAGGKGIDVSRVIRSLGGCSVALGFMGGYNGLEIEGRLTNEGLICDFTRTNGETRQNITIHQRNKKMQTLLSTAGDEVAPFDVTTLCNRMRQIPSGSHVVLCGRIPPGLKDGFYAQIITTLKERGIKVFLDADGEPLKQGVNVGPYLVKPNIHEFARLVDKNIRDHEDILDHVTPYTHMADHIVVSMGARGAIGIRGSDRYHVVPPKVAVRSSLGAGDATLAGLVYAMSEGRDFQDALMFGVACGTASTLTPDGSLCSKEDVEGIRKAVEARTV
jgi:6-phosphofructokinase 2